jgi:hypothetical protein
MAVSQEVWRGMGERVEESITTFVSLVEACKAVGTAMSSQSTGLSYRNIVLSDTGKRGHSKRSPQLDSVARRRRSTQCIGKPLAIPMQLRRAQHKQRTF